MNIAILMYELMFKDINIILTRIDYFWRKTTAFTEARKLESRKPKVEAESELKIITTFEHVPP